jgi:hypothetical protein
MRNRVGKVVAMIVAGILFVIIGGQIVLHLWNWLLPPLFGWHVITFWQALGLLVLCRVLFGRMGGRGFSRGNFRQRMRDRWDKMSPEERERFRDGMRGRCGSFGSEPNAEAKP